MIHTRHRHHHPAHLHRHHSTSPARLRAWKILIGGMTALLVMLLSIFYLIARLGILKNEAIPEQMAGAPVTIGSWQQSDSFSFRSHPVASFSIGQYYYVMEEGYVTYLYYAKQGANGALVHPDTGSTTGIWKKISPGGGYGSSPHGATALSINGGAYYFRNGNIIRVQQDASNGNIPQIIELQEMNGSTPNGFGGKRHVWDSAVFTPFSSGEQYIYHFGGWLFSPYGWDDAIQYRPLPFPDPNGHNSNNNFIDTGKTSPTKQPGMNAFYQLPGQTYGYAYLRKGFGNDMWRIRIDANGTLGNWETQPAVPSGTDNQLGDMFLINNTLFAIGGKKTFYTSIDDSGTLSGWSDANNDLPNYQIDNHWGGNNTEGASYGIIGQYVYITGQRNVYFAQINGSVIPGAPTSTPAPNTGPEIQIVDFSDRAENKPPVADAFGVTVPTAALNTATANELTTLFSGLKVTLRLVNPAPGVAQDAAFSSLNSSFNWYFTFYSYDGMRQFLTAYYARADAKPVIVGLTVQADAANTQSILTQFPQVKFHAQEFGIWPRGDVKALLGRVAPPNLNAVSFTLNSVSSGVFDDIKLLFDTMFDAVKDIAGGSVTINYPSGTSLALVDTRFASTTEGIARKTGVLSGAIVAGLQGTKNTEAPIRTIIAGDFSGMGQEERTIIRSFAQFITDAPRLYYPWTHPGNGEPFDKQQGNIKPAWGIAGEKNGKVYAIFTNTSTQSITLKFPDKYAIAATEPVYSTTRGSGTWIQNNRVTLGSYETIAITGTVANPVPTVTPGGPGATSTPVPGATAAPTTIPTKTPIPTPTNTPRPTLTPKPVVHTVRVTIPVMAIKLGVPSPSQNFIQWLQVFFQFILPGKAPVRTPTPTKPPENTPTPVATGPTATLDPAAPPTGTPIPSATPDPAAPPTSTPVPTAPPIPTATPVPLPCPNTSSYCPYGAPNCFITLDEMLGFYPAGDPPPSQHPDLNISKRGYQPTNGARQVIDVSGNSDPKQPPQLDSLFHPARAPQISSTDQVFDWDWTQNTVGPLITNPEASLIGLSASVGESLYPPFSDHNIGDNVPQIPPPDPFQVYVVYADANRITLKYDRIDSAASGYLLHIENICTDVNLLSLYNTKQYNTPANRTSLIGLRLRDSFGTARTNEVLIATRANGSFLDPRTRKNWWRNY